MREHLLTTLQNEQTPPVVPHADDAALDEVVLENQTGEPISRLRLWLRRSEAFGLLFGSFLLAAWVVSERDFVTKELNLLGIFAYPVAVLLLAVVASAPFSVTDALAIMNGVIFGPVKGSLVNAAGIACAAVVGYYVAKRTSSLLELDSTIDRLPKWARHFRIGSFAFLVTVRILPGIGGTVATQVAAAKRVPLWIHVAAMCAIAVPICTALAFGGDTLANALHARVTEPIHKFAREHHVRMPHVPHFQKHEPEVHSR